MSRAIKYLEELKATFVNVVKNQNDMILFSGIRQLKVRNANELEQWALSKILWRKEKINNLIQMNKEEFVNLF